MFVPYNPRLLRMSLFACAIACVALAAWALASARASEEITDWARLGVAIGLLGAFVYVFFRVRPRDGWGVAIEPLGVTVSRPLSGESTQLVWSQIAEVRRDGKKGERILIRLKPDGRFILGRHLFASAKDYETLAKELESRAPKMDA